MTASPFEILQRQAESRVRSQVQKEKAQVRRELSLVGQIRQMYGLADRTVSGEVEAVRPRRRPERKAGKCKKAGPTGPVVCADGYQRRSPVQPYRCPEDKSLGRRAVPWLVAAAVVLAALLAWMIWKSNLPVL